MMIENSNLPDLTEGEMLSLKYIDFLEIIKPKSVDSIKSIFEVEFDTFRENVDRLQMMGMDISSFVNSEIKKQWDYLNDEKNALLKTLCSKTIIKLIEQKTLLANLLDQYYLPDTEDENENEELEVIKELLLGNIQPDPSRLSDEEKQIPDISAIPQNEQMRIIAKLLGVSVFALEIENKYRLDCIYCWQCEIYFKKLIEFSKQNLIKETESSSDKYVSIKLPKLKERLANDKITSLTSVQTAMLFNMLRREKIIFKDESYQSKENIYKAIQILTGYSNQNMKVEMNKKDYDNSDRVVVQNFLRKLLV